MKIWVKEMKISYIREMKRSYLLAEPEREAVLEYEANMLASNKIQGLLKMRIKYRDGGAVYYYDITSRQPLGRLLETHSVTLEEIRSFMFQLHETLDRMEQFLLGNEGLLLEPDYIYVEPGIFDVGLCLIPGRKADLAEALSSFLQYLLKHIDHKDRECVVLAYGLYQESLKENYGIDDLLKLMADSENTAFLQNEAEKTPWEKRLLSADKNSAGQPQRADRETSQRSFGQPETAGMKKKQKGSTAGTGVIWKQAAVFFCAAFLISGVIWLLEGKAALFRSWKIIAAGEGSLLIFLILGNLLFGWLSKRKRTWNAEEPWQILYEEEEEEAAEGCSGQYCDMGEEKELQEAQEAAGAFQTVLLSGGAEEGIHRLEGKRPETEDIIISYYPFVVGKHKELADHILNKETVSRFHLRVDRQGEKYTVTDLNSTNGTMVRGVLLDANETVEVKQGDEVMIADIGYIWK